MLFQCWADVEEGRTTLKQHCGVSGIKTTGGLYQAVDPTLIRCWAGEAGLKLALIDPVRVVHILGQ